ncbi:hypothetical protein [Neorhizobium galegae]|uniref:hypothetical protein n=1 Tax=Neorhizobium galegae TaxID=399 RepID=UPI001AEE20EB|nr:hypothetical protein [Neorhizobium galegae]
MRWRTVSVVMKLAGKTFSYFYPYYQSPTGSLVLDDILSRSFDGQTLATRLRNHNIGLVLEPGRALLDGAGMSVFPVLGYKENADYGITSVAGLSMSISEQWKNSEFLLNPVLLQKGSVRPNKPVYSMIGGSSCMEYDVLTYNRTAIWRPDRLSQYRGYQMDESESEFHQLPLPPKVVIEETGGTSPGILIDNPARGPRNFPVLFLAEEKLP